MGLLHKTREWKGYGKQNYYHNEYRDEGDEVVKVKVHRQKFFDGDENTWSRDEHIEVRWKKDDSRIPEWLRKKLHNDD